MADVGNTGSTASGMLKRVYDRNAPVMGPPQAIKVLQMIDFEESGGGDDRGMAFSIQVSEEEGFTYAFDTNVSTIYNYNDAQAAEYIQPNVAELETTLKALVAKGLLSAAVKSEQSFERFYTRLMRQLYTTHAKRREILAIHGQRNIGVVESVTYAGSPATTATIEITAASWATGIWAGARNRPLTAIEPSTPATVTANAPLVVTGVDIATRTLTISGNATDLTNLAADDELYFFTAASVDSTPAVVHNVHPGIMAILDSPTTLFGITTANYDVMKGQKRANGGADLSFNDVAQLAAACVGFGQTERMVILLSHTVWEQANTDLAALRRFDRSYRRGTGELGNEVIEYTAQNGVIQFEPSIYMKQGEAALINPDDWGRPGTQDISTRLQDLGEDGKFFQFLTDKSAFQCESFSRFGLLCYHPASQGIITGIKPPANPGA